jgi:hypothetical protein
MNYEDMEEKVRKLMLQEQKPPAPTVFTPATAHHKFDISRVAMRTVYNQFKSGSLQIDKAKSMENTIVSGAYSARQIAPITDRTTIN